MSSKVITVSLTVTEDPTGKGKANGGSYDYTFIPDSVHVTEKKTLIVYELVKEDRERFEMVDMYTTDTKKQFAKMQIIDKGTAISVIHENSRKQLTVVSLRVKDRARSIPVNCDPQVTNDPPPVGIGP
jgi:hypothetical protein